MIIKFFCRSFNARLYALSKALYAQWGYECVRLTNQTADGYFYTMLQHTDCDIAINVDEDCFIIDKDAVLRLVDYVVDNQILNAGFSDSRNPLVTNPFFNVFNWKLLREKTGLQTGNQVRKSVQMFYQQNAQMEKIDFEPYGAFFLWLTQQGKTLYLDGKKHSDTHTTILSNHEGKPMCMHTWYARFYSVPDFITHFFDKNAGMQKDRIDAIIDESYALMGICKPLFTLKDEIGFLVDKIIRWVIKIPQRIIGWRVKIKRYWKKRKQRKKNFSA